MDEDEKKKPSDEVSQNSDDFNRTVVVSKPRWRTGSPHSTPLHKIVTRFGRKRQEVDDIIGGMDVSHYTNTAPDTSAELTAPLSSLDSKYSVLEQFAKGGHATVSIARDKNLRRIVAIKSLKNESKTQEELVESFVSEAKVTAQLDHPAIVPLFSLDTDTADGLHLAMQLVNGITLKEYLNRCRDKETSEKITSRRYERSLQVRLESFLKVCDAIEYCHSRGIIHCDLKPENIMLGKNGEVYVMDWGIACPDGTDRRGNLDGTPAYMAPELFEDGVADPQTDVFALGMILNEIVTLRKSISGADSEEVIAKIRSGEFEPSTPANPKLRISPALRAIIEKARAVDPTERYRSAKELASDIRHYLFDEEVSARPDTPLQKFMRFLHRHRNLRIEFLHQPQKVLPLFFRQRI